MARGCTLWARACLAKRDCQRHATCGEPWGGLQSRDCGVFSTAPVPCWTPPPALGLQMDLRLASVCTMARNTKVQTRPTTFLCVHIVPLVARQRVCAGIPSNNAQDRRVGSNRLDGTTDFGTNTTLMGSSAKHNGRSGPPSGFFEISSHVVAETDGRAS